MDNMSAKRANKTAVRITPTRITTDQAEILSNSSEEPCVGFPIAMTSSLFLAHVFIASRHGRDHFAAVIVECLIERVQTRDVRCAMIVAPSRFRIVRFTPFPFPQSFSSNYHRLYRSIADTGSCCCHIDVRFIRANIRLVLLLGCCLSHLLSVAVVFMSSRTHQQATLAVITFVGNLMQ